MERIKNKTEGFPVTLICTQDSGHISPLGNRNPPFFSVLPAEEKFPSLYLIEIYPAGQPMRTLKPEYGRPVGRERVGEGVGLAVALAFFGAVDVDVVAFFVKPVPAV